MTVTLGARGTGSGAPLDDDRMAHSTRAGVAGLVSVPVMRRDYDWSARVVGSEVPTEPLGAVWAVRPEGEGLTHD